ncbi:hypothetical protein OH76DRAFT_1487185 [Lentinus brumalis]|uniref:Uncharacterized protein n=1 Tax=Lentinus brumalis TaxID=2498619 RepID=A0A371CVR3_9APHY|nr:hypothetical protein OH76DRAFT_1487185 [Polyporus brumalis]
MRLFVHNKKGQPMMQRSHTTIPTISTIPGISAMISDSTTSRDHTAPSGLLPTPPVSPIAYHPQWAVGPLGQPQSSPGMPASELQRLQWENAELQHLKQEKEQLYHQSFAALVPDHQAELDRLHHENTALRAQISMAGISLAPPSDILAPTFSLEATSDALKATSDAEDHQGQPMLHAHFAGTRSTYEMLTQFNLPMTKEGKFKIITYSHKGHENHPYWTQRVGNTAVPAGEEKESYLTNPDGTPVSKTRAKEIRGYLYDIWQDYATTHGVAALPKTWGRAPTTFKCECNRLMLGDAPELGFCHDGWHGDQLGQDNWSQWRRNLLAGVDPRSVTDPLLVEEILAAAARRAKQLATRQAKRAAKRSGSLDAAPYTIKTPEDDLDCTHSAKRMPVDALDSTAPLKQARTMPAVDTVKDTSLLSDAIAPLPARNDDNDDFNFEYLDPTPDDARIGSGGGDMSSGNPLVSGDDLTLSSDISLGDNSPVIMLGDETVYGAPVTLDNVSGSSAARNTPGLGARKELVDSAAKAADTMAETGSTTDKVPPAGSTNGLDKTTAEIKSVAISGPSIADANTGDEQTVVAAEMKTKASTDSVERAGDITVQPRCGRIANPFTSILSTQARVPVAPAQIAPVPAPKDKKPKVAKVSGAWPPVRQEDSGQKDICAILWFKETGGTKDAFNKFYGSMKDYARKKWKAEREPPADSSQEQKTEQEKMTEQKQKTEQKGDQQTGNTGGE